MQYLLPANPASPSTIEIIGDGIADVPGSYELENPTHKPAEAAAIHDGQQAWLRLRNKSTWQDWKAVGVAHVIGRATAMLDGNSNKPKGRGYCAAFHAWAKKFGSADFDKGDRARLFDVMDHLPQIEDWLAKLAPKERLRLNHPTGVWRRWKAATGEKKTEEKISPQQKLRDELVRLQEDNDRMKREIDCGGADIVETGGEKKSLRVRDLWPDTTLEERLELFQVITIDELVAVLPNQLRQGLEDRLVRPRGLQRSTKLTKFLRNALKSRSTATHITELVNHFNRFLTENNLDLEKVHVSIVSK
jgi:hypothetical protein